MLVRDMIKVAMFLTIVGLISTSREVVSSALIPLIILAVPHFAKVRVCKVSRSYVEFVGDLMDIKISLKFVGFGIVKIEHVIPDSLEIVEGSNVSSFFILGWRNVELRYKVEIKKAGLYRLKDLKIDVRNPLNTWRNIRTLDLDFEFEVKPKVRRVIRIRTERTKAKSPIPDIDVSKIGSPGTEFREIRDYNYEPMKFINWKATARTGSLKVNVYEVEGKKTVWFFVDANVYMERVLDFLITLTASLSYYFAQRGHKIGMYIVGLRELLYPDVGFKQFGRILESLSRIECGEEGLNSALELCKPYLLTYKPYVILITRIEYSKPIDFRLKLAKMGLKGLILNIKKEFGSEVSRGVIEVVRRGIRRKVMSVDVDADKDVSLALARLIG